jgi:zinc protease
LIGFYRLPLTYLEEFTRNVERVTIADIKSGFARRVDPDRMVTVVVGPETERASGAAIP